MIKIFFISIKIKLISVEHTTKFTEIRHLYTSNYQQLMGCIEIYFNMSVDNIWKMRLGIHQQTLQDCKPWVWVQLHTHIMHLMQCKNNGICPGKTETLSVYKINIDVIATILIYVLLFKMTCLKLLDFLFIIEVI